MNIKEKFLNQKLNIKFTCLIILLIVIPIGVFAGILFYYMEQNTVKENLHYMGYTMQRNQDAMQTRIDSINMSTQFFLSDEKMIEVLNRCKSGETLTTQEWFEFKKNDVSALERLVNNNPLLYGVRVYAMDDSVQEMMPVLYGKSRMDKQSWSSGEKITGWQFCYNDNIFSAYTMNQDRKIISLISAVTDTTSGQLGYVEAAMTMNDMFPSLYEGIANEWSCFRTEDNQIYFGENEDAESSILLSKIIEQQHTQNQIETIYMKAEGRNLVVSYLPIHEMQGTLICVKDITQNVYEVYTMRNLFVCITLLLTVVIAFLINVVVKRMLKQFYIILKNIREVQKGDLQVVIENCGQDEMGELGTQINKMLQRIRQLMDDNLKREMLVKNSEIRALQNQINAHFIYNVLESIKMMAEIDEEYEISDAVTSLGKLLRYSMKWVSGNVLVEQELEYIKNYMALINLRFDYEIYLSINISEEIMKQEIPKMSLQPIIENAIYHGIEQLAEDTNIYMKGFIEEGDCIIEITDSGKGMTDEQVTYLEMKIAGEMDSNSGSGNGIGLKNVQDRIHIAFGEQYGIEIASKLGCYTKIRVRIPLAHPAKKLEDI